MRAEGKPLPEGWIEATVGELSVNHDGRRVPVKASDRKKTQGSYPYYGASGIIDWVNDYIFDGRYLLVAEDGANLLSRSTPIAFVGEGKFWVNNHAHVLEPLCDLDYLMAALNGTELSRHVTGSAQPKLTQKSLNKIMISLPPTAEQRRIVAKIEALTARSRRAREALEALPALLDRYRASVLAAAFRGDLTKDWREEHAAETDAWDLPPGWRSVTLNDVASSQLGKMLDKGKRTAGRHLPYLRNVNVRWYSFETDDLLEMPFEEHELERYRIEAGDLVICEGGEPGRCAIWTGNPIMFQKALHRVRTDRTQLDSRWLMYFIACEAATGRLASHFTGSTIKHLTGQALKKIALPLPPVEEQLAAIRKVERALSWASSLRAHFTDATNHLTTLDQSILAKAFRGELVPQDPTDEPATALLERIRARRAAEGAAPKRGRGKVG